MRHDEPATEPVLFSSLALAHGSSAHTMPVGRASVPHAKKKSRVSFTTVTSTTFRKDSDDPFKLSSPQERLLSPLPDSSVISECADPLPGDDEETTETTFEVLPTIADLVATPESKQRRDSTSGGLGNLEREFPGDGVRDNCDNLNSQKPGLHNAQNHSSEALKTPLRQKGIGLHERGLSGGSNMAVSLPSESPGSSVGELTGDVTAEVRDLENFVVEDELMTSRPNAGSFVSSSASLPETSPTSPPSEWCRFEKFKEEESAEASQNQEAFTVREVPKPPRRLLVDSQSPTMENLVQALDKAPKKDAATDRDSDVEIPEARKSFAANLPVYDAVEANTYSSALRGTDAEMSSTSVLETPAYTPRPSSQGTIDFEAMHQDFDQRIGRPPGSSPQGSRQGLTSGIGGGSYNPYKAPGLSVLASIGGVGLPEKRNAVVSSSPLLVGTARSRSPLGSGRFSARSPPLDFATWANSKSPKLEQSPRDSESGLLPAKSSMHPISQLTGYFENSASSSALHSAYSGTRTRMCWEEFISNCDINLPRIPDQVAPPQMENSSFGGPMFACARSQALHECLQHGRAEYLQKFVYEITQHADRMRNEYCVETQMWDRNTELPLIVHELLRVQQNRTVSPSDHESFIAKVKDWFQHCRVDAWLKWYVHKRQWLEGDLELVRQHTQVVRDEVQRASEATRRCKAIQNDIRDNFKRVQHTGELHDIRQGHADLKYEMSKRRHEEQQLQHKKVPEMQVALEAARRKNSELEDRVRELKRRIQQEKLAAKEADRAALQQRLKKSILEKQRYARTCIIKNATARAVCLQFRGKIHLWVERATHDFVRISADLTPSSTSKEDSKFIQIAPQLGRGLLACVWHRVLAITSDSVVKQGGEISFPSLSESEMFEQLQSKIPSQEVARFIRYFDVEVLQIVDKIKDLRNLRTEIPEVSKVIAGFQCSQGVNPTMVLTIYVSALRSHSVSADGVLRPLTVAAKNGEVDAVQCILKVNEDLMAASKTKWSEIVVERVVGCVDTEFVQQSLQSIAHGRTLREIVASAVQAMRRTTPGV